MKTWWLSFAGSDRKNVGVIITNAATEEEAISKVTHPAGAVDIVAWECAAKEALDEVKQFPRDTIITPDEMRARGYKSIQI